MKILYVGHTYTVRANHPKIAALARASNVQILLLTPHAWKGPLYNNQTDPFDVRLASNVRHVILRAYGIGKESRYVFGPGVASLIKEFCPDIIHVEQGVYAMVYAQILMFARIFAPQARTTFFTWWNLPYTPRGLRAGLEHYNLKHSTCAFAGNEEAKEILMSHGFSRLITVLPQLGIDRPADRKKYTLATTPVVGYVGRIEAEKGVHDLVNSLRLLSTPPRLLLVGGGTAAAEVVQNARMAGLDVIYHAAVRNELVPDYILQCDVLVLPSRTTPAWVEQFGHILIEAMSLGVPVIGSNSGEIPHVIGDGGIVFPEGDTTYLAQAIDSVVSNPAEWERLSIAGYERSATFTHDAIATVQAKVYDWMIAEGSTVGRVQTRSLTEHYSVG